MRTYGHISSWFLILAALWNHLGTLKTTDAWVLCLENLISEVLGGTRTSRVWKAPPMILTCSWGWEPLSDHTEGSCFLSSFAFLLPQTPLIMSHTHPFLGFKSGTIYTVHTLLYTLEHLEIQGILIQTL